MHLVETYALACGAKIDKPYLYEKYFPVPNVKYITFQPFGQTPIKNYDYWQEVVNLLLSPLNKVGIKIMQIGTSKEKRIKGCLSVMGHTSINQAGYVINRGELHFGADSFGVHLASVYQKKVVALYSNNIVENVKPYWSSKEDAILLEPDREGKKPNYANEEDPKSINTIKPEDIAESVCRLLDIKFSKPYETVFFGERYGQDDFFVHVPDMVHRPQDDQPLELRMDYHFNEDFLAKQLSVSKCAIITKKPIDLGILVKYRASIAHLFYEITQDDDPSFARHARRLGIQIVPITKLSEEELSDKKIGYMDVGRINVVPEPEKKLVKKIKNAKNLFYKSNKIILSQRGMFSSQTKFEKNDPFQGKFEPTEASDSFFGDLDHYHIVKLLD